MARRGLRRRLQVALGLLVIATAAAAAAPFVARRPVDAALQAAGRADGGIAAVLRLSIAVREAYAHQAHTFVLNNTSHMEHYREAKESLIGALAVARGAVAGTEAAPVLVELDADAQALDIQFRDEVVPQVGGDRARLLKPAEDAIARLERMQAVIDRAAEILAVQRGQARTAVDRAMARARVVSASVLLVALLVAAFAAALIDRSLSRPLGRLEAATDAVAAGDLHARVADDIAQRDDELGSLASRFNAMAERLAEREARLLEAERLATVGRLAAGVAHEINNPLGVILGNARHLEKRLDDEGKRDIAGIVDEVVRCRDIVGGLLDLSRPPRLRLGPVDLEELCRDTRERLGDASVGQVEVNARGDVEVEADGDRV